VRKRDQETSAAFSHESAHTRIYAHAYRPRTIEETDVTDVVVPLIQDKGCCPISRCNFSCSFALSLRYSTLLPSLVALVAAAAAVTAATVAAAAATLVHSLFGITAVVVCDDDRIILTTDRVVVIGCVVRAMICRNIFSRWQVQFCVRQRCCALAMVDISNPCAHNYNNHLLNLWTADLVMLHVTRAYYRE
jgi:hypothetical protein